MKIEVDFQQTIKSIDKLKEALNQVVNAWYNTFEDIYKQFKNIRFEETNNYLKYHKKPMKRRRWIK